jgi:hypothetical protein
MAIVALHATVPGETWYPADLEGTTAKCTTCLAFLYQHP